MEVDGLMKEMLLLSAKSQSEASFDFSSQIHSVRLDRFSSSLSPKENKGRVENSG